MSDDRAATTLRRLFALLAEHLEEFLAGDELALERLGAALEEGEFGADELQAALLTLRSLASDRLAAPAATVEGAPGSSAQRVPSREERESLSPEAWGYLLGLRRRGSLDAGQFERVLDRLAASGVRPIDVEMAHQVAVRVAMAAGEGLESPAWESDVAH